MILYHGSQKIIKEPAFGAGKKENDYGQGFYCTESLELAKEWACPILEDGFVNKYTFNVEGLNVLRLNSEKYHILNWLAILLHNRRIDLSRNKQVGIRGRDYIIENFMPEIKGYDVVIGYRADDRYFAFSRDFVQNVISVRQLANAMKLGKLGEQVVLISKKAFENIHFNSYEIAESNIYYYKRIEREALADKGFYAIHNEADRKLDPMHNENDILDSDLFMLDIIRKGIKNDDIRLR